MKNLAISRINNNKIAVLFVKKTDFFLIFKNK